MTLKYEIEVQMRTDGTLVATVVGLPGCTAEAKTHEELIEKTKEAIRAYLKIENSDEDFLDFV